MNKEKVFTPEDMLNIDKFTSIVNSCTTLNQLACCLNIMSNIYTITKNEDYDNKMKEVYFKKLLEL